MKKKYDAENFLTDLLLNQDILEMENEFPNIFYNSYYRGTRNISQKQEILSKKFDIKWIETIESYLNSLNMIARTARSNLKYEEEVVPVELARNISSESVVHLITHTENIREITDEGVIPKKILTDTSEIDYGIYENRFVMTLVLKLKDFVNERVKIIKNNLSVIKKLDFDFDSEFVYEGANYKVSLNINQEEKSGINKITEYNNYVHERAQRLLKQINQLIKSPFMELMKGYNKVTPPIMKTQVILKNRHFKNAYLLWLFLDKNSNFEYDIQNSNLNIPITSSYDYAINKTMLLIFTNLLINDGEENDDSESVDVEEATRTSPNFVNYSNPKIEIQTENEEVEDVGLNEYFINKAKEIFKQQIETNDGQESNYRVSLQKALKDTIEITNALYASFFEINADKDIFRKLVRSEDPVSAYNEAKKKHDISKIIRQEKEKDYLNAIELENKWVSELSDKQEKLLQYEKKLDDNLVNKLEVSKKAEFNRINKELEDEISEERKRLINEKDAELLEYYNDLKADLNKERRRIKAATLTKKKETLIKLKQLQDEKQNKIRMLRENYKTEDDSKYQEEKSKIQLMYDKLIEKLKDNKPEDNKVKLELERNYKRSLFVYLSLLNQPIAYLDKSKNVYVLTNSLSKFINADGRSMTINDLKKLIHPEDIAEFESFQIADNNINKRFFRLKSGESYYWFEEKVLKYFGNDFIILKKTDTSNLIKLNFRNYNEMVKKLEYNFKSNIDFGLLIINMSSLPAITKEMGTEYTDIIINKFFTTVLNEDLMNQVKIYKINLIEYALIIDGQDNVELTVRNIANNQSILLNQDVYVNRKINHIQCKLGIVHSKDINLKDSRVIIKAAFDTIKEAKDTNFNNNYCIYNPFKMVRKEYSLKELGIDLDEDLKQIIDN